MAIFWVGVVFEGFCCFWWCCFLNINFYHNTFIFHPPAGSGITVTLQKTGSKNLWPLASSTLPISKRGRKGDIPVLVSLESSWNYRKGLTTKVKPCSVLCAQVFCLLGDIDIRKQMRKWSSQGNSKARTQQTYCHQWLKLLKGDLCLRSILVDKCGILLPVGRNRCRIQRLLTYSV